MTFTGAALERWSDQDSPRLPTAELFGS
jgi:hypothetical protein